MPDFTDDGSSSTLENFLTKLKADTATLGVPEHQILAQIKARNTPIDLDSGKFEDADTTPLLPTLLPGLYPLGAVSLLGGASGGNKTATAKLVATLGATGVNAFTGEHCGEFASLLFLGEDSAESRNRHLRAIATAYKLTKAQRKQVRARVAALPYGDGKQMLLTARAGGSDVTATGYADDIIAAAREHAQRCGVAVRLIAIDHARLVAGGSIGQDGDVMIVMGELARIAHATGAAVVVVAHITKEATEQLAKRKDDEPVPMAFGSIYWEHLARQVTMLAPMTDGQAKRAGIRLPGGGAVAYKNLGGRYPIGLYVRKFNEGKPDARNARHWLRVEEVAAHESFTLKPVEVTLAASRKGRDEEKTKAEQAELDALVKFLILADEDDPPRHYATATLLSDRGAISHLNSSRSRLNRRIKQALKLKYLREQHYNRHNLKLGHNVRAVPNPTVLLPAGFETPNTKHDASGERLESQQEIQARHGALTRRKTA